MIIGQQQPLLFMNAPQNLGLYLDVDWSQNLKAYLSVKKYIYIDLFIQQTLWDIESGSGLLDYPIALYIKILSSSCNEIQYHATR